MLMLLLLHLPMVRRESHCGFLRHKAARTKGGGRRGDASNAIARRMERLPL